jgi:hypothetical protein
MFYPKHNSQITLYCDSSKRKKKKKIRRIIDDAELGEETKRKIAIEKVLCVLNARYGQICYVITDYPLFTILCRNVKNA